MMFAPAALVVSLALAQASAAPEPAEQTLPPRTYELMIDGESFLIDLDRQSKLQSKEKPGTAYQVAVRISPQQRIELNSLRFQYDWPATVSDDHGRPARSVRVRSEAGYTILLTDMGNTVEAREEALKILIESATESIRDSGGTAIVAGKPHDRKFAGCEAKGTTLRYKDRQDFEQTCVVYLLTAPNFAASCVVQYFEKDAETVLPRLKAVLDSVQALRAGK